jgi:hypothetical protein
MGKRKVGSRRRKTNETIHTQNRQKEAIKQASQ